VEKNTEILVFNTLQILMHRIRNIACIVYSNFICADPDIRKHQDFLIFEEECLIIIEKMHNLDSIQLNTQCLVNLLEILKQTKSYIQNNYSSTENVKTIQHFDDSIDILRIHLDELMQYQSLLPNSNIPDRSNSLKTMLNQIMFTTEPYLLKNDISVKYKDYISNDLDNVKLPLFLLRHAIFELIKNSVDMFNTSQKKNKTIQIETFRCELFDQPYVGISITDNGLGIPLGYEDLIFEKDFTTKQRGTGLGLWDIRQMILPFGSILRLAPSEIGAKFELLIPLEIDSLCKEFESIITSVIRQPEDES